MQQLNDFANLINGYTRHVGKLFTMHGGVSSRFSIAEEGRPSLSITRTSRSYFPARITAQKIINSYQKYAVEFASLREWSVEVYYRDDASQTLFLEGRFIFKNQAFQEIGKFELTPSIANLRLEKLRKEAKLQFWDLFQLPYIKYTSALIHLEPLATAAPFYVETEYLGLLVQVSLNDLAAYSVLALDFNGRVGAIFRASDNQSGSFSFFSQAKRFLVVPNQQMQSLSAHSKWSHTWAK